MSLAKSGKRKTTLATRKYNEYCQRLHQQRLKTIKAAIDNKPPKRPSHLKKNMKREQMMEERYATIERENRLLLEKMSHIMQGGNSIDNKNNSHKFAGSMNKTYRKAELQRITRENQAILRRIQACEPCYNHLEWEESRQQNEEWLQNICEYPVDRLKPKRKGRKKGKKNGNMYPSGDYQSNYDSTASMPRMEPNYDDMM